MWPPRLRSTWRCSMVLGATAEADAGPTNLPTKGTTAWEAEQGPTTTRPRQTGLVPAMNSLEARAAARPVVQQRTRSRTTLLVPARIRALSLATTSSSSTRRRAYGRMTRWTKTSAIVVSISRGLRRSPSSSTGNHYRRSISRPP